jgi:hypothetical protein
LLTFISISAIIVFTLSSDERIHIGGYHGTDMASAEHIAAEGFQESNGDVFFAPLNNLSFAQQHGERRARDRGDSEYGVIQATFPGKRLELGMASDQIQIPPSEIGRIAIIALWVYSVAQAQLLKMKNRSGLNDQYDLDS